MGEPIRNAAPRPRRTLQGKLVSLVVGSVGVAVLLVTAAAALKDGAREGRLEAGRLSATAQVLASMSAEAVAARDTGRAYRALSAISHMPGVVYGRIETAGGATLVETGSGARLVRDTDGASDSWWRALSSRSTRVTAPVLRDGARIGRVVLLSRGEGVGGRLAASLLASLLASAVAMLAGVGFAWRLQRRIAAPVTALTAAMTDVQRSHDYARAVSVQSDDEVGQLVTGFNAMLSEIRARDAEIARQVQGLEHEVAARTAELVVARDAAEDANRAKSDFLAAMSHEIRTPMNGVMVMAEMLASSDLPPKPRRFAEVIAKSGAGLVSIINDILDVSKIEAGKLELEREPVDLGEIVEDVLSLFWDRAASKALDLAAFVSPAAPRRVAGDPVRLRQVVSNLVNNAVKFTEAGGVLVEVEPAGADAVVISVRDTGVGIAPDKIAGLFEAFTQADQSTTRRFGGTGLGLNICKRLADAMGGEFRVTSTPGRGSTFALRLPVEVLEPAAPLPPSPGGAARVLHPGVATRRALSRHLRAFGLEVEGADADGEARVVFADPTALAAPAPGPAVCLASYADPDAPERLRCGHAQALLLQPFRRADLLAIFAQLSAGEPLSSTQEAAAAPAAAALPTYAGARVLVADDSAVNREVAAEALARLGIAPVLVEDGRQAVDAWAAQPFDLVLMDGSMPVLDGYEAAREIRARESGAQAEGAPRTPVVALTAHVVGPAAEAWREAGMDAVLHKPFTLADLAAVVGRFLAADPEPRPLAPSPRPGAAPPAAEPAPSPLLDADALQGLAEMGAGAPDGFVARVRRLYADNAPGAVDRLAAAAAERDASACAAAAHALKSMSFNIGARAVAETAGRVEEAGREGRAPSVAQVDALRELLRRTLQALDPAAAAPEDADAVLARELARAIDEDALALVFQPQFDRAGQTVVGVEALVRWPRPGQEPVDPERLARVAEASGLVGRLTDWVARRAMAETRAFDGLKVAVNASALDFTDRAFPARVRQALADTGFDPARLELEITETAVISDDDAMHEVVETLREMGVGIALDDFGAGYSSLRHLRAFPFGKLKIDRQFITDCERSVQSATIVHAVVSIGRALGMKVVAEGVETQGECDFLRSAGVHAFQGYLFCRPISAEALARVLHAQAGRAAA